MAADREYRATRLFQSVESKQAVFVATGDLFDNDGQKCLEIPDGNIT